MRPLARLVRLGCALACCGCGTGSTAHWVEQTKSPEPKTRLHAVRILQQRKEDAAQSVPALIEALKDEQTDIRRDAAWTLGSFGAEAKCAVPTLAAALRDPQPSVRRAAAQALKKIDPDAAAKPRK
jgi:HEAT repeat protein